MRIAIDAQGAKGEVLAAVIEQLQPSDDLTRAIRDTVSLSLAGASDADPVSVSLDVTIDAAPVVVGVPLAPPPPPDDED